MCLNVSKKNCQPRFLYRAKNTFQKKVKAKYFSQIQKLKESITSQTKMTEKEERAKMRTTLANMYFLLFKPFKEIIDY